MSKYVMVKKSWLESLQLCNLIKMAEEAKNIIPLPTSAEFAGEMEADLRLLDTMLLKYCPQVYKNTVIKAGVDELFSMIAAAEMEGKEMSKKLTGGYQPMEKLNTSNQSQGEGVYGYCPMCGARGIARERRPYGNDRCENGHCYPSAEAIITMPEKTVEEMARELAESNDDKCCPECTNETGECPSDFTVGRCFDCHMKYSTPAEANGGRMAILVYNKGYHAGHNDTVEAQYVHILDVDMETYHADIVDEILSDIDKEVEG